MADEKHPSSSIQPRGFFAFSFLIARIITILALSALAGLTAHLIISIVRAKSGAIPGGLVGLIILASTALLWSGVSWNGYTRRLVHYAVTYTLDIILLVPFVALSVILTQPMTQAKCSSIPESRANFTISAPANTDFGKISLPGNGRAACHKIFAVWILLMIVAVTFIISAASAQIIHLREIKHRSEGPYKLGDDFSSDPSNVPGNDFFTQRPTVPGREYRQSSVNLPKQWDSFGNRFGEGNEPPRSPHDYPMGSFGRSSFFSSRREEDGDAGRSSLSGSPVPSSSVLREYKPRGPGLSLNRPPEAARVYQGPRSFRRSSSIALSESSSARPRSRQRGFEDPRLNGLPRPKNSAS